MKNFTVVHTGYPVAGRAIQDHEWKVYSTHATESAAWKAVGRAKAGLEPGTWNDHYRVVDQDGANCDFDEWRFGRREGAERAARRREKLDNLAAEAGFGSWTQLETSALRGEVAITRPPDHE